MVKLNLETVAVLGGVGYLALAYFMKLFPFDGSLDEILGEVKGAVPGLGPTGTDPAAIDPLTGTVGPAINPAAGAADKTLTELEILAATKSQYQSTPPLVTGDVQGIGDTTIYSPALPGAPPAVTPPAVTPPAEEEVAECAEWCTGECNKLTGAAKTKCSSACASVCAQGAGATETEDEEESTIPPTPAEEEEEEEEPPTPVSKYNKSLCSSKFNGKCNTECQSPNSSVCKECKQVCGESSNFARSYFVKRAFPAYRDYITPVGAEPQMLRRGRARTGFRSYKTSTEAGFDSLRGASTIKVRRFAMSS